ncbi:MAG: hypothetical protein ACRD1E_13020, partial [Terriglobales bacterium]
PPAGYRSSVACNPAHPAWLLAAGPTGVDISTDRGAHWAPISQLNFNAVAWADARSGWAAGARGAIYFFTLN